MKVAHIEFLFTCNDQNLTHEISNKPWNFLSSPRSTPLYGVVQAMKKFAAIPRDDAGFWQPAPLLAKLAAQGSSFT